MSEAVAAPRADFTIEQDWAAYSAEEHAIWRRLFRRQQEILRERACPEFLDGLAGLGVAADLIPDVGRLNALLDAPTVWTVVAIAGLVPAAGFCGHLAHRRFPANGFCGRAHHLDSW